MTTLDLQTCSRLEALEYFAHATESFLREAVAIERGLSLCGDRLGLEQYDALSMRWTVARQHRRLQYLRIELQKERAKAADDRAGAA